MINQYISEDFIHALGWTVIHSLWQAILIAVIMMIVLFFLQKKSAHTRYWVANFALIAMLSTSIWTFCNLFESQSIAEESDLILLFNQETAAFLTQTGQLSFLDYYSQQFHNYFNEHLPLIVMIWGIGVAFFVLRLFGGLFYVEYLKYNFNTPLSAEWQDKLQVLQDKIPVQKTVALMESALIKVPMVMGYFKPMILLPIGIVNALDSEQIEAILAHELAHIYRNDFLLNILQSVVEVLFYFNPAVWWISANIRMERENCCDDIAVKICGNTLTYAKALVSIQDMNQAAPSFAMTFSGGRKKNQLLNRVKRILHQPQNKSNIMEKFMATCFLLVAFVAWSVQANSTSLVEGNAPKVFEIKEHHDEFMSFAKEILKKELEKMAAVKASLPIQDTIPNEKRQFHRNKGNEEIEMTMDGDDILELKVNGKTIPKEDMEDYEEVVADLVEDMNNMEIPTPPTPPMPPSPPMAPELPKMVIPAPPMPPMPPAPPSPPSFEWKDSDKVFQDIDENGNTFFRIEREDGDAPMVFEFKDGNHFLLEDDNHFLLKDGNSFLLEDGMIDLNDFDFKIDDNIKEGIYLLKDELAAYNDFAPKVWGTISEATPSVIWDNDELVEIFGDNLLVLDTFPDRELSQEERLAHEEAQKARQEMKTALAKVRKEQQELAEVYRQEMDIKMKEFREKEKAIQKELRLQQKEMMKEKRALQMERSKAMRDDAKKRADLFRIENRERKKAMRDRKHEMRLRKNKDGVTTWAYGGTDRVHTGDIRRIFEEQLMADGFIKNSKDAYKLELTGNKLSINGKKQSQDMLKKYKELYKSHSGTALKDSDTVSIRVKSGSVSTSIQIEDEE